MYKVHICNKYRVKLYLQTWDRVRFDFFSSRSCPVFGIDSLWDLARIGIDCKMRLSCNWIDTGYGVGHLLHNNVVNLKRIDNTRRSWNKSDQKGSVHKEPY